jgi:hypothetical protein
MGEAQRPTICFGPANSLCVPATEQGARSMGLKNGNKGKYYRERRKRNARRAEMRAYRVELLQKKASAPPKAGAAE